MDIKSIIREMLNSGMNEQQIKDNLKELGIEDADSVFADAVDQMKPLSPSAPDVPKPAVVQEQQKEQAQEKELFSTSPIKSSEPQGGQTPGFSFTRVSGEGEKEELVDSERQELAASANELMKTVANTSVSDLDSVEQKLDQTIALLKALQDINQKILQSQRDVLLRLK